MTATETTLSQIADVVPLRHGLTALYFRNRELRRLRSLSPEQRQGQAS